MTYPKTPFLGIEHYPIAGESHRDYLTWLDLENHLIGVHEQIDTWARVCDERINNAGQISGSYLGVINVLDYGADPTGVKNCYTAFSSSIAAQRLLHKDIIIPSGTFNLQFSTSASYLMLNHQNVRIRGAGADLTKIITSHISGSGPSGSYEVFKTGYRDVYISDLQISGTYPGFSYDPKYATTQIITNAMPGGFTSPRFNIIVERCKLLGHSVGIAVAAGPVRANGTLTLFVKDTEIAGGVLCIDCYTDPDFNEKILVIDGCWIHDTDHTPIDKVLFPNDRSGSHLVYVHPGISFVIRNTRFGNPGLGDKFCVHNWGGTHGSKFSIIDNCSFDHGWGTGILTNENGPFIVANSYFNGANGIYVRNSLVMTNCVVRPSCSAFLDGKPVTMVGVTTYADAGWNSSLDFNNVHFDFGKTAGSGATGISIDNPCRVTANNLTFTADDGGQASDNETLPYGSINCWAFHSRSEDSIVRINNNIAAFTTSSLFANRFMLLNNLSTGSKGDFKIFNSTWAGSTPPAGGAIEFAQSTGPKLFEIISCRLSASRANALRADSQLPAGVIRGYDNQFCGSPVDLANYQYIRMREGWGNAPLTANTSSVRLDPDFNIWDLASTTASISQLRVRQTGSAQRAFGGSIVRFIGNGVAGFSGSDFAQEYTPAANEVVSWLYNASASLWHKI